MVYDSLETVDYCDECWEEVEIYMEGLCWDCYDRLYNQDSEEIEESNT